MSQAEFHARYEQAHEECKAELVDGTVFIAPPVIARHGQVTSMLIGIVGLFTMQTRGVTCLPNVTVIMGPSDEVQPDLALIVRPEYGGRTNTMLINEIEYLAGPPEFLVEIAHSTRSMELHVKRQSYMKNGIVEYLVICLEESLTRWFDLASDQPLSSDSGGILRIRSLPGLWINAAALFCDDHAALTKTIEAGLASPEHAEFVERLEAERVRIAAEQAKPR